MIYTCTLNPSIDYIMSVPKFESGTLNRAHNTSFYPGGKGINVSRVLRRLGVGTIALGFTGGFSGNFIKQFLSEERIEHRFIDTDKDTRINVKLKSSDETEINGPGPELTTDQQEALLKQVDEMTNKDTLVLAGSVPSTLPPDFYMTIADICAKNRTKFVADTSGKALDGLIGKRIFLLKPNHHELGELFKTEIDSLEQTVHYGRKLFESGVEHVIVSMGGSGAIYIGENKTLHANVPEGVVKNSVGAGDSVVSGFLAGLTQGRSIEESFRFGVAAGSATAFQDDLCEEKHVSEVLENIEISFIH
ncbi:1-phosphofructokinase [Halobacillus yeomjeoni]|uniref:Tagatose-6-phosphate kinase n=1 Tax=Halobacillus yeomjeoni TaxID=311194 RepID=A0A931HWZ3_9BACI|nr:1-phosphofructokinase [Halobacillus yeomjeoni]MBH0230958.1 1-phosphofructokinase [Halobacillus yeomjeoni]